MNIHRPKLFLLGSLLGVLACALATRVSAQTALPVVKIVGFGTKSGVLRQFGANSEAAMRAAVNQINADGGIKLSDGRKARMMVDYVDDRCNVDEGVSLVRRFATEDWLAAVGTTCSPVVEAVFGQLQHHVSDTKDPGLRFPVFTDVAMKMGLTRASDWAFRNIPDEPAMYQSLFAWLRQLHPEVKTVYGGVEENFVHSRQTWYNIMKPKAESAGYDIKGEAKWLVDDTNFAEQVREIALAKVDAVIVSAHPFTACGVLKEMQRQSVHPKLLIGLTSISSPETLEVCGRQAEGLLIPTSFAPITPAAKAAANATAQLGGYADLHSMATWEIMYMLKQAIEAAGIEGTPSSVEADRLRIRSALAALKEPMGLLGRLERTEVRESVKPFVFVAAHDNTWSIVGHRLD